MTQAIDDNGNPMQLRNLFTICEAADIAQVRQWGFEFMTAGKRCNSGITSPDEIMITKLRPVGSEGAETHFCCHRLAYCDEFAEQAAKHSGEWSAVASFRCYEMTMEEALGVFDLEVC